MNWQSLLAIVGAVLLIWWGYRTVKGNPQAFSSGNFHKSAYTLGLLALLLIGIIVFFIFLLKD